MASDENEKIREIFAAARKLVPAERDRYLKSACYGDESLRKQIQSLLANDNTETPPTAKPDPIAPAKINEQPPLKTIGPYRLLEMIGSGGMGVVYKAEQRSPIRRTVAVKIIKLGFDSHEVIARFESERQALARMDHPNIARVLDAGTDDRGSPYFVMEYVPGQPVTKYADENRLSIQQRLELMLQVCDAIGHAHAKAIIHRDIKAGNVLAHTTPDGPRVKVIDFGVAKALTSDRLTDLTFNTASGQAIGTYESMSPEQADGSPDIDTRTDVYSLGVLLYELLSGSKPFDKSNLAKAAHEEIRRIIREDEPPRPSTQLSSLGESATKIAKARRCELEALTHQLKSELDWIPLKAIRKERERRYATPQQLSEDIQNYLQEKPLTAAPDSSAYRLTKFARRNRGPIIAGLSILAILVVAICVTSVALLAAKRANAETNKKQIETQNAKDALEKAGMQTRAALTDSEVHRKEAEQQGYNASIAAAANAIEDGQMGLAREWLDGAVPSLRRWEWGYLRGRSDSSLAVLKGHAGPVLSVVFSQDGKTLLTMSADSARLWNAESGVQSVSIIGKNTKFEFAAITPDGANVITACENGIVERWDAASGDRISNFTVCSDREGEKLFGLNSIGTRVVTRSLKGIVSIWSTFTGKVVCTLPYPQNPQIAPTLNSDGEMVITGNGDSWTVWNTTTGRCLLKIDDKAIYHATFSPKGGRVAFIRRDGLSAWSMQVWDVRRNHQEPVNVRVNPAACETFSPDGNQIWANTFEGWGIWNAGTGTLICKNQSRSPDFGITHATFCATADTVATFGGDFAVRVSNAISGKEVSVLRGHGAAISSAAFSRDGSRIVTSSRDATIRVWDVTGGRDFKFLHGFNVENAAFSPNGQYVTAACYDGQTSICDPNLGIELMHFMSGRLSSAPEFSKDMTLLACGSVEGTVVIADVVSGLKICTLNVKSGPKQNWRDNEVRASLSPDGKKILIRSVDPNSIGVWDISAGRRLYELDTPRDTRENSCTQAEFSSAGDLILTSFYHGPAELWDARSGKSLCKFASGDCRYAEFNPNATLFLTLSLEGTTVWDTRSGKSIHIIEGGGGASIGLFNPEGTKLAIGQYDGTARVFNAINGIETSAMRGHEGGIYSMDFNFDGSLIVTGSNDKTIRVWDASSGKQLITLRGHVDSIRSVAFSPDGSQILSVSAEGTARIWDSVSAADRYKATGQPLIPPYHPADATQPSPATSQSSQN